RALMSSFYERFMTGARRRSRACCAPVSRGFGGAVAREFIAQHVVTVRLVKNEQKWARQYSLFVPTDTALKMLLSAETAKEGSLIARVPQPPQDADAPDNRNSSAENESVKNFTQYLLNAPSLGVF